MRTTLTLDEDVAVRLKALSRNGRFKDVVNRALRLGLAQMDHPERAATPYSTPTSVGRPKLASLDNVWEVIAEVDGDPTA